MMESGNDEIGPSQGVHVKVSTKNCLKEIGGIIKSSVEDNNRNITHCPNSLIESGENFGTSSKHVSCNGLVNGVDLDKYQVQISDSPVSNNVSKNSSSLCEKCPSGSSASDSKSDKTSTESRDVKFALECKKALQELILDSNQECCDSIAGCSTTSASCERLENAAHRESLDNLASQGSSSKDSEIVYVSYENEHQMPDIMRLIQKDLSEPYSIYTYRYFIHKWPQLCFLAMDELKCVGAIVCKLDIHRKVIRRGYIAMLAVDEKYRKRKIGTNLVLKAIRAMVADNADEIVLETEITNNSALCLYENLGFVRDKRLFRYYLNGVDALRLKLWLR